MKQPEALAVAGDTRRRLIGSGAVLAAGTLLPGGALRAQSAPQKITIAFPTRSGASWPMFIAKDAGYYAKYGLDVNLQFGVQQKILPLTRVADMSLAADAIKLLERK